MCMWVGVCVWVCGGMLAGVAAFLLRSVIAPLFKIPRSSPSLEHTVVIIGIHIDVLILILMKFCIIK